MNVNLFILLTSFFCSGVSNHTEGRRIGSSKWVTFCAQIESNFVGLLWKADTKIFERTGNWCDQTSEGKVGFSVLWYPNYWTINVSNVRKINMDLLKNCLSIELVVIFASFAMIVPLEFFENFFSRLKKETEATVVYFGFSVNSIYWFIRKQVVGTCESYCSFKSTRSRITVRRVLFSRKLKT